MFLSFPPGTEMFQFPGCPSLGLCIHPTMAGHYSGRVSPFGHLRINACLRLPVAFRSLPRPSSAYGALASALCSSSLDFSSISPKTNLISSSESLHRTEQSLIFDYRSPGNRLSRPYCAVVKVRRALRQRALKTIQSELKRIRNSLLNPAGSVDQQHCCRRYRPGISRPISLPACSLERR